MPQVFTKLSRKRLTYPLPRATIPYLFYALQYILYALAQVDQRLAVFAQFKTNGLLLLHADNGQFPALGRVAGLAGRLSLFQLHLGHFAIQPWGAVFFCLLIVEGDNGAGVHDLYICFDKASGDVRLDWWQFKK